MLLFAYILIISTRIFKIFTFFYQVIILLNNSEKNTNYIQIQLFIKGVLNNFFMPLGLLRTSKRKNQKLVLLKLAGFL